YLYTRRGDAALRREPAFRVCRSGEAVELEVSVFGPCELTQIEPATPPVRLQGPDEQRLARQKCVAEGLAVPAPENVSRPDPPDRPPPETREDHRERRVEPHNGIGTSPDDLPCAAPSIVAVDDPGVRRRGRVHATAEERLIDHGPVRSPVQCVELDMWHAEDRRQLTREGRL